MKKISLLYSLALCLMVAFGFTSCNDNNDDVTDTTLTYYVTLKLKGPEMLLVPVGSKFVDPGVSAMLEGQDYTKQVVVSGVEDVDVNKPGLYHIEYSAKNKDGYSVGVERTVAVYNPEVTTDLSGDYVTAAGTKRIFKKSSTSDFPGFAVHLEKVAPGMFSVSDFFGGFYSEFKAYGSRYSMGGILLLNNDNTLEALDTKVSAWGDAIDEGSFKNAKYDPDTNKLTWSLTYAGNLMEFIVNLEKK